MQLQFCFAAAGLRPTPCLNRMLITLSVRWALSSTTCVCLQVLNLDFCTLSSLPPVLGQLTSLTTLDVEGNLYLGDSFRGATTTTAAPALPGPPPLPLDLAGLQGLRFLNLNSCGLTALPMVSRPHCPLGLTPADAAGDIPYSLQGCRWLL